MENVEIADRLNEKADLLEIQGANPFRVRAYRNAARYVENHDRPMRKLVEAGEDLTELPNIGDDISGFIEEMVETGTFGSLEALKKEVPETLAELMRLPGIGPKRAQTLWKKLEITSVEDLRKAAEDGRVAAIEGFGEKTQQKILDGIDRMAGLGERFKLSDADQFVVPLREHMEEAPGIERLEIAGSYRRRKETVGDIDLLAVAEDAVPVMEHFTDWREVDAVEAAGETRGTVILRSGLQVDLRIVEARSFGAALVYFTGSKAHNIKLRRRAMDRGLRISEYGVFDVGEDANEEDVEEEPERPDDGEWVAGETEEEVYARVDLPWIPPEMREDQGEIEAAEEGELPNLIEVDDIRGDLQMHSTWSDGSDSIEEMLKACIDRGYEYLAVTDHSPSLAMTGGLDEEKLREQWEEMDELDENYGDDIRLIRGMEVDIHDDGSLDLPDELLEELELVLVSIHSKFDLSPAKQTERIVKALEHPAVNILGHPTGRLINKRPPMEFDMDVVLECAVDNDVAVEIDSLPERLDLPDRHVMRARDLGVKIVIDTDAHSVRTLDYIHYGVEQARRAWLTMDDVLNTLPKKEFLRALGL